MVYTFLFVVYKPKGINIKKMTIYEHFYLYNLYTFVWIQQGCLAHTVFTLDLSNCVKKMIVKYWAQLFKANNVVS